MWKARSPCRCSRYRVRCAPAPSSMSSTALVKCSCAPSSTWSISRRARLPAAMRTATRGLASVGSAPVVSNVSCRMSSLCWPAVVDSSSGPMVNAAFSAAKRSVPPPGSGRSNCSSDETVSVPSVNPPSDAGMPSTGEPFASTSRCVTNAAGTSTGVVVGVAGANRRDSRRRRLVYFQASSRAPGNPSSAKRAIAAARRVAAPPSTGCSRSNASR